MVKFSVYLNRNIFVMQSALQRLRWAYMRSYRKCYARLKWHFASSLPRLTVLQYGTKMILRLCFLSVSFHVWIKVHRCIWKMFVPFCKGRTPLQAGICLPGVWNFLKWGPYSFLEWNMYMSRVIFFKVFLLSWLDTLGAFCDFLFVSLRTKSILKMGKF